MKKRETGLMVCLVFVLLAAVFGCATVDRRKGTLPEKWWTINEYQLENYYRENAEGSEKDVVLFLGYNDALSNYNKSTAIDNASMKASGLLSQFLIMRAQEISQGAREIVTKQAARYGLPKEAREEVQRLVTEAGNDFQSRVSVVDFSSFRRLASYAQEREAKPGFYEGWALYSMTETILIDTVKLQATAFQNLMEQTEKYKEIMAQANEEIAALILENIRTNARIQK